MQSRPARQSASVLSAPAAAAAAPTKTGGNTVVVFLNKTSSDPIRVNDRGTLVFTVATTVGIDAAF